MELKTVGLIVLATAIMSAVVTKYYFPKIQTQTVEVEKEVVKNHIITIVKNTKNSDGSETTETRTEDTSTKRSTDTKSTTVLASKDWVVSGSAQTKFDSLQPIYGVQVQRRILGPFYVGAMANTDHSAGLSIGFEF